MVPSHTKSGRAQAKSRSQRARWSWIAIVSLGAIAGAAVLVGHSPALFSDRSSITVTGSASDSVPTGAIAESDREFCKRLRFDDSGRAFQDVVPCDGGSTRDARDRPVPQGTMHRLDAISKSFSGP